MGVNFLYEWSVCSDYFVTHLPGNVGAFTKSTAGQTGVGAVGGCGRFLAVLGTRSL